MNIPDHLMQLPVLLCSRCGFQQQVYRDDAGRIICDEVHRNDCLFRTSNGDITVVLKPSHMTTL